MDPVTAVTLLRGLSGIVPGLVRWVGGDKAGRVAEQAVQVAREVSGIDHPPDALEAIRRDPQLQIQLQQAMTPVIIAQMETEARELEIVNATMRAEFSSDDAFVRRWRPTFGYAVAISWIIQMVGIMVAIGYAVLHAPKEAGTIINAIGAMSGALTLQWSVALAVLGISVHERSKDKQVRAGQQPDSALGRIVERVLPRRDAERL